MGSLRPNFVWPTLLRFWNLKEFRFLRKAARGLCPQDPHKPFEKGLTENFLLAKAVPLFDFDHLRVRLPDGQLVTADGDLYRVA